MLEIEMGNSPVNALRTAVRRDLLAAVSAAQFDEAVKAIVLCGEGRIFSAEADITEFDNPLVEPNLPVVIDAI